MKKIRGARLKKVLVAYRGKIAEAAIYHTGNINDPTETKFTVHYYKNLAKELEQLGLYIISVKDRARLLKPHIKSDDLLIEEVSR